MDESLDEQSIAHDADELDSAQLEQQQQQQAHRPAIVEQSSGPSENTPISAPRSMKKRLPLTNIACDDCRKRKIKCDGERPRCASCVRRNVRDCQYELDSSQTSRVAAYKLKIEQQEAKIEQLQNEVDRVLQSAGMGAQSPTPGPLTGSGPYNPSAGYGAPGPSSRPISTTQPSGFQDLEAREQEIIAFARSQALERERFDREGLLLDQQRTLQYEILQLKELLMLLTLMDDRALAQRMALRIREEGVTDGILAQAQGLYASRPWTAQASPLAPSLLQTHSTGASSGSLPSFRTLNLPSPSEIPATSGFDPRLQAESASRSPR